MLPMILGFLGSAFAPAIAGATGIAALASPLLAGAIGTGLGTFAETGDLKSGIKSGLGSFVGGKLLGGLMGSTAASGPLQQPLPGQSTIGAGANAMTTGAPLSVGAGGINSLMPPAGAVAKPSLFGSGALGQGLRSGMDYMSSAEGIGSMIGGALVAPTPQTPTIGRPASFGPYIPAPEMGPYPGADYTSGVSPEYNYRYGVRRYAEGGETEIEVDEDTGAMEAETKRPVAGNEKTEIVDAIMAIKGQHSQPEIALGKFLAKYGEDALRDLVDSVQSGEFDETVARFASGEKGQVRGPGDGSGVDDKVPAAIDGEQDVLLADGEFVLRKDATDALEKKYGGGFLSAVNKAGKDAPKVLERRAAA